MFLEDIIFWFSTCFLTLSVVATATYDYILTEVQTGGYVYAMITIPVLWYSSLEVFLPFQSRQAYLMLLINEYFKFYLVIMTYFFVFYLGSFDCAVSIPTPAYPWLSGVYDYMCYDLAD